eukprot:1718607-Pyramimonas_sp.AAC.1
MSPAKKNRTGENREGPILGPQTKEPGPSPGVENGIDNDGANAVLEATLAEEFEIEQLIIF